VCLRIVLRRMRDVVTEEWRKLNNEKLNDLQPSTNIILDMKSRR
jgi:hypothetical protein